MNVIHRAKEVLIKLKAIEPETRGQLWIVSLILFAVFFSYPIIRSTVDATFLDIYGAHKSPHVWIYSVIFLSIVVYIYNILYKMVKIHYLYLITSLFTVGTIVGCVVLIGKGYNVFAYPLYVIKEAYIVLLFHMVIGWLNSAISFDLAKVLYGPLGALNSISGIIGGYLTSGLTYKYSTNQIMMIGVFAVIIAGFAFLKLSDAGSIHEEKSDEKESPFRSIGKVKKYIFWMGIIIMLTQFCINMANFKFFVLLEQFVTNKLEKTRYLGQIYSSINTVSLFIQIMILPIALRVFKNRSIHIFIPIVYMFMAVFGFFIGGGNFLLPVAAAFVVFKGFDYSLFSTAKELLYFPLTSKQKYGAKYLIDIVVYRFGKGLISFLLGFQIVSGNINYLLVIFLILWLLAVFPLFKEMKKIVHNKEQQ